MAKKTTARAKKAVKMTSAADLLNWVWGALGEDWSVHVDYASSLQVCRYRKNNEESYTLWVMNHAWTFNKSVTAPTIVRLASMFQQTLYPEIQAEWTRRNRVIPPPPQKAIETHQPRIVQKQLCLEVQR